MPQHFDRFVMVDWSASNKPTKGADSIWVADRLNGELVSCVNLATRALATDFLLELCRNALAQEQRVLFGFDFPFGYPAGSVDYFTMEGEGEPWQRLWRYYDKHLVDAANNQSDRFQLANSLNQSVGRRGPFWGHPSRAKFSHLQPTKPRRFDLAERRLADHLIPKAQSVWKLAYIGSVGSQVVTGLPRVRQLRYHPDLEYHSAVWPFELDRLGDSSTSRLVFAEIYPSFWDIPFTHDEVKDAQQVKAVTVILEQAQRTGELTRWLEAPLQLEPKAQKAVRTEEAWILGLFGH